MKEEDEDPFPKVDFNWEMLLGKPDHRCFGMTGMWRKYMAMCQESIRTLEPRSFLFPPDVPRHSLHRSGRRKVYPVDPIHTKFGSVLNPIRGSPNLAPNKYDVDRITSMDYLSKNKLTSDKG